jgi:hypothetical protein
MEFIASDIVCKPRDSQAATDSDGPVISNAGVDALIRAIDEARP